MRADLVFGYGSFDSERASLREVLSPLKMTPVKFRNEQNIYKTIKGLTTKD
jgi:hypothetical protein